MDFRFGLGVVGALGLAAVTYVALNPPRMYTVPSTASLVSEAPAPAPAPAPSVDPFVIGPTSEGEAAADPRILSSPVPSGTSTLVRLTDNPVLASPKAQPPADSHYLYPQRGIPDGRGGVITPGVLYEVYQRLNGSYWLRPAG